MAKKFRLGKYGNNILDLYDYQPTQDLFRVLRSDLDTPQQFNKINFNTSNGIPFTAYNSDFTSTIPVYDMSGNVAYKTINSNMPPITSSVTIAPNTKEVAKVGLFRKLWNTIKNNKPIIGQLNIPGTQAIQNGIKAVQGYQPIVGGPKISTLANTAGLAYQGINAYKGLSDISNTRQDLRDLRKDILAASLSNPMAGEYLDQEQQDLLRDVKNGRLDSRSTGDQVSSAFENIGNSIPKALLNTLIGGVTGGLPGAAIQGIGTLANAGIQGANTTNEEKKAKLQDLYETLRQGQLDYKSMKRPGNILTSGLRNSYRNQLI